MKQLKPHSTLNGFTAPRYGANVDGFGDDASELSSDSLAAAIAGDTLGGFHVVSTTAAQWASSEESLDFSNVSGYRTGRELVSKVASDPRSRLAFAEQFLALWPTLDAEGRRRAKELMDSIDLKVAGVTTHHKDRRAIATVLPSSKK